MLILLILKDGSLLDVTGVKPDLSIKMNPISSRDELSSVLNHYGCLDLLPSKEQAFASMGIKSILSLISVANAAEEERAKVFQELLYSGE